MHDSTRGRGGGRRHPRRFAAALATLLTLTVVTACGSDSDDEGSGNEEPEEAAAEQPQAGGTLTVALQADPISINPRAYTFNDVLYVSRQVVDSLVAQDPETGEIVPWLAESWEVDETGQEFTFTLRDDVTFSDGTPLDAEVVKANFDDLLANEETANPDVFRKVADLTGVEAVDASTVVLTFGKPNAPFLQAATEPGFGILAPATLELGWDERAADVIGTGPFVLESYTTDTEVVLSRREGYGWAPEFRENDGDAHLDEVVFQVIPEAGVRTGGLESGDVQVATNVPAEEIETLRDGGFEVLTRANPGTPFGLVLTSTTRPPLDDADVRQALRLAIDSTEVRDTVLGPDFPVATSSLSSTTPGYVDLSDDLGFDPDEAVSLLEGAGWGEGDDGGIREKDGEKLSLVVTWVELGGPSQTILELIKSQLAEVGIELEILPQANNLLLDGFEEVRYDVFWTASTQADGDVLRGSFSSAPPNFYNVTDEELQPLLEEQAATSDAGAREGLLADIQAHLLEQGDVVPVVEQTTVVAADGTVHGLALDASSRVPQLADVWLS